MLEKPSFPVDADDEELEQYGVWVKAGPEDIEDSPSEEVGGLQDLDQSSLPEESFLTDEEEELLSDLESDPTSVDAEPPPIDEIPDLEIPADDVDEMADIEPMLEDLESAESNVDIDLGFDTEPEEDVTLVDIDADMELSLDEDEHLPEIDEITEELVAEAESSIEELDLDDLPEIDDDTLPPLDEEDFDGIAIPTDSAEPANTVTEEIHISADGDLESDLSLGDGLDELGSEDPTMVELQEMSLGTGDEITLDIDASSEDPVIDIALDDELEDLDEIGFEDDDSDSIDVDHLEGIALEETDAEEIVPDELVDLGDTSEQFDLGGGQEAEAPDSSILMKIENELSAIKDELTTLKDELAGLRAAPGAPATPAAAGDDAVPGFFEEVEDETIALTGDEMENILNTADIMEEAATEESEEPSLESAEDLQDDLAGDISAIDFDTDDAAEDIDLDSVGDFDDLLETEDAGIDSLDSLDEALLSAESDEVVEIDEGVLGISEDSDRLIDRENIIPLDEIVPPESAGTVDEALEDLDTSEQELLSELEDVTDELDEPAQDESLEEIGDLEELSLDDDLTELSDSGELADGELEDIIDEIPSDLEDLDEVIELTDEFDDAPLMEELEEETVGEDELGELEEIEIPTIDEDDDGELLIDASDDELGTLEDLDGEDEELQISQVESIDIADEVIEEVETFDSLADQAADEDIAELSADISSEISPDMKQEMKSVLTYMDHLLESLPQDKIKEFVDSGHFEVYKKLFDELGLRE